MPLTKLAHGGTSRACVQKGLDIAYPACHAPFFCAPLQLGMDGVFVGSGIFKSGDPAKRARAIVQAVTHYNDPAVLAEVRSWAAGAAALACLPGEGQEGGGRRALGCLWPSLPALVLPSCSLLLLRRPYQFPVTLSPPPPPPPPPPPRCRATWVSPWWASTCGRRASSRTRSAPSKRSSAWTCSKQPARAGPASPSRRTCPSLIRGRHPSCRRPTTYPLPSAAPLPPSFIPPLPCLSPTADPCRPPNIHDACLPHALCRLPPRAPPSDPPAPRTGTPPCPFHATHGTLAVVRVRGAGMLEAMVEGGGHGSRQAGRRTATGKGRVLHERGGERAAPPAQLAQRTLAPWPSLCPLRSSCSLRPSPRHRPLLPPLRSQSSRRSHWPQHEAECRRLAAQRTHTRGPEL